MNALWVLLELVSLAALLVLVGVAVLARERSRPSFGGDDSDEPDWWPDFEREFALYAASQEAQRSAESPPQPHLRRPRRSG
jgi:hypothetical protein